MDILKNIIVTNLNCPFIVNVEIGHSYQMVNRKSYGLSFCSKGSITYSHKGKKIISNSQNAVILPKGQNYNLKATEKGSFFVIDFQCQGLEEEFLVLPFKNSQLLEKYAVQIQRLLMVEKNKLKALSVFYEILSLISKTPKETILQPALKYIEENLKEPSLNNKTIAEKIGISEVYFRKLFSKEFGISPKQYIIEKRLDQAKLLLINSPLSITAVSLECGFSSLYLFCRTFKEKLGQTPSQYIKENKITTI